MTNVSATQNDELIRKSDALNACAPLYGWSAVKLTITPEQANALSARILAALTPNPVDDSQPANPAINAPDPATAKQVNHSDAVAIREAALKAARDALAYIDKGHHGMARNILAAYLGAAE